MSEALRAILVVLLLFGVATHANGSSPDFGERWELYRMTNHSQSDVTLVFEVEWDGPATVQMVEYDGLSPAAGAFAWFTDSEVHVAADSDHVGLLHRGLTGPSTAQTGWPMLAPGTREVLVIWTGGIKSVERWIEGDAEYELLAEGPARGYSGVELEGGAFASASASNVAAHASMGRSLEFQIDHLLVGWFLFPPIFSGAYPASATLTSDDSFDRCVDARFQTFVAAAAPDTSRCLFSHRIGLEARGAGSYELDWTGAGAAYGHIPLIGIADVEWPSSG